MTTKDDVDSDLEGTQLDIAADFDEDVDLDDVPDPSQASQSGEREGEGDLTNDSADSADLDLVDGETVEEPRESLGNRAVALTADLPVQVVAVIGKKTITMQELLAMEPGQLIEFGLPVTEVVDLVANGKLIARGELVEIDSRLGVKIIKMIR